MYVQETQKCQYSMRSPSNINNKWEIETDDVGQRNQGPYGNYFYKGVRQITSISLVPLAWALHTLFCTSPALLCKRLAPL